MPNTLIIILSSAMAIGFIHTLIGPDHYVPLIAMSKVRSWSMFKTFIVTLICGIAHVGSAAILGMIAVILGFGLAKLNFIESFRGNIAVWLLIGFGLVYLAWSIYKLIRHKHHHHHHHHIKTEITPWVLCLIFVLGPCEPLIPLMLYPAIRGSLLDVFAVIMIFGMATIMTMLSVVVMTVYGTNFIRVKFLEKYGNVMAGAIICSTGVAIKVFGL
jgi:nickel/cobalt exporter